MPLSNPSGGAQSYIDWKFSQPLFIEGGDPYNYSSGREIDGIPVSEAEFQRRIGNGSAVGGLFLGGKFAGFIDLAGKSQLSYLTVVFDEFRSGQPTQRPDWWNYIGTFVKDFELNSNFSQNKTGYNQNRSDSKPMQDRKLKVPEVTETGRPLSQCAQGILRKFLEDGPYWQVRDRGFRVIDKIQLYSGIPEVVKRYSLVEADAFTYGNNIFLRSGFDPAKMDHFLGLVLLAHEFAHSLQADKHGAAPIFGALYLTKSGTVYLEGKDPYRDNKYEVEAREFEGTFKKWLEKEYGKEDPCKKFSGAN